uniref:Uncharacterized protein n=1 Tax=Schistocephalus solidus TaxID=70667 RepID=A0A0X3Q208_SCHSO
MEKSIIQLAVGLSISILFLILALALSNWRCGALLNSCLNSPTKDSYQIVGGLLLSAIILDILALVFVIVSCARSMPWPKPTALALTWAGGILSLTAVAYYYSKVDQTYSPLMAVIGMSFALAMAINVTIRMIAANVRK